MNRKVWILIGITVLLAILLNLLIRRFSKDLGEKKRNSDIKTTPIRVLKK